MPTQDTRDTPDGTEQPALLTIDQVCELMQMSRITVLRAVKRRTFPAPVVLFAGEGGGRGRCHRWRRQEVLDAIENAPRSTDLGTAQ